MFLERAIYPTSLPSRGARVEMRLETKMVGNINSRSPRGERGLKSVKFQVDSLGRWSLPSRGARVEIFITILTCLCDKVAPLAGSEG